MLRLAMGFRCSSDYTQRAKWHFSNGSFFLWPLLLDSGILIIVSAWFRNSYQCSINSVLYNMEWLSSLLLICGRLFWTLKDRFSVPLHDHVSSVFVFHLWTQLKVSQTFQYCSFQALMIADLLSELSARMSYRYVKTFDYIGPWRLGSNMKFSCEFCCK